MDASGAGDGNLRILGLLHDLSELAENIKRVLGESENMTVLIGSDCLRAYDAKIDLKKGNITFSVKENKKPWAQPTSSKTPRITILSSSFRRATIQTTAS